MKTYETPWICHLVMYVYYSYTKLNTVFARSDAAATIYFITQSRLLFESGVYDVGKSAMVWLKRVE